MKRLLWYCAIVLSFGLGFSASHCSVQQEVVSCQEVLSDSYDEFDLWVDVAVKGGVLKKDIEFEQPTRSKRIIMRCMAPLVWLYTSTVLKYRAFKAWVARHATRSKLFVSSCFCCRFCNASAIGEK